MIRFTMPPEAERVPTAGWSAWKFELWALICSAFSFSAMVVLLAIFNDQPTFDWESVTLNAIIATLTVAMKASLTFAVAELIGQWKWILFSRDARPLMDFERIDMASRGPLGSREFFDESMAGACNLAGP